MQLRLRGHRAHLRNVAEHLAHMLLRRCACHDLFDQGVRMRLVPNCGASANTAASA